MGEAKLKNTRFIAFASERRLFMLTIAYIGNGKSTNRYHLPFATQVEGITVKTIYNRSLKDTWQRLA